MKIKIWIKILILLIIDQANGKTEKRVVRSAGVISVRHGFIQPSKFSSFIILLFRELKNAFTTTLILFYISRLCGMGNFALKQECE